jgi:hypothetical protein
MESQPLSEREASGTWLVSDELQLDEVRLRLRAAIAQERGLTARLRALPTQGRIGIAVVAVALTVVLPRLLGHFNRGPSPWTAPAAAPALVYAAILIALLWSSLWPLQRTRSRFVDVALLSACLLAPFGLVDFAPGGACGLLGHLGYCFFIGTAVGWTLVLLLRALDRGGHQDRTAAWLSVGVASLATNLALQFDCPETGAPHRLACHATIGVALGLQYLAFIRWHEWRNTKRSPGRSEPKMAAV